MTKRAAGIAMMCIGICGLVALAVVWGQPLLRVSEPATITPEPIDVDAEITINPDWEWGYGDILLFKGGVDGCICGKPRDGGRMCDVYVKIVTDTMLRVWTDASPEQLRGVVGIEWVSEKGKYLCRDPRYTWRAIADGICALAENNEAITSSGLLGHDENWLESVPDESAAYDSSLIENRDAVATSITIDCCACCDDGGFLELEFSEFCP